MRPIHRLRKSLGMKQAEFAESVGTTQSQVSVVEKGDSAPSRAVCLRAFDCYSGELERLGITLEDLLRHELGDADEAAA